MLYNSEVRDKFLGYIVQLQRLSDRKQQEVYLSCQEVADTKTAIATNCWHCRHGSIHRSYVRPSVCRSVYPSVRPVAAVGPAASIDIDCCTAGAQQQTYGKCHVVSARRQTCLKVFIYRNFFSEPSALPPKITPRILYGLSDGSSRGTCPPLARGYAAVGQAGELIRMK